MKFQTVNEEVDKENYSIENVTNFRDFAFIVTPRLKSEFHKEYSIALDEFKKLEKAFNNIDFRKISASTKKDFRAQLEYEENFEFFVF